jgi:hypothetical protein
MITKKDAEYLIDSRIIQPKSTEETAQVNSMLGLSPLKELPAFTRGAARLYKVAIKRVRVKKWQTDPVEDGKGVLNLKSMARAAQLSFEKAKQYYYQFVKENLMELSKGTGFKGKDEYTVTPERLYAFPQVSKTVTKTQAQRMREYRARKNVELKALRAENERLKQVTSA